MASPFAPRRQTPNAAGTSIFAKPGGAPATRSPMGAPAGQSANQRASQRAVAPPQVENGQTPNLRQKPRTQVAAPQGASQPTQYVQKHIPAPGPQRGQVPVGTMTRQPPGAMVTSGSYTPPLPKGGRTPVMPGAPALSGSYTGPPPVGLSLRLPGTMRTSGSYTPPALSGSLTGSYAAPPPFGLKVPPGPQYAVPVPNTSFTPPFVAEVVTPSGQVLMESFAPRAMVPPAFAEVVTPSGQVLVESFMPPTVPQFAVEVPSGSYVAPPRFAASGSYTPPVMVAGIPPVGPLFNGDVIADEDAIEKQRQAVKLDLDRQFHIGLAAIANEREAKRRALKQQAEQAKAQFALQVQSQLDAQCFTLEGQLNTKLLEFQENANYQRKGLEEKAAALSLDYQQKKASEELLQRQYLLQKQFIESELTIASEFRQKQAALESPMIATNVVRYQ